MSSYSFRLARADIADLSSHLRDVAHTFTPPLETYVAIDDYSEKLFSEAEHCLALDSYGKLVGLIAFYFDRKRHSAFVSNVSIIPDLQGKGVGSAMFEYFQEQMLLAKYAIKKIELEVRADNTGAVSFYEDFGFCVSSNNGVVLSMRKEFD